jgi:hypothetical protein
MWLLLAAGCDANRIAGTIDGQPVPVETAFSRYVPGAFGGDDLLVVSLVSFPSACPSFERWERELERTDDPDALEEVWETSFPADWWQVDLVARLGAGTWPVPGEVWVGLPVDGFPEQAGDVFVSVTHHHGFQDQDVWLSDGGATRWKRIDPPGLVRGRTHTVMVDEDGQDAGELEVFFRASPCYSP